MKQISFNKLQLERLDLIPDKKDVHIDDVHLSCFGVDCKKAIRNSQEVVFIDNNAQVKMLKFDL